MALRESKKAVLSRVMSMTCVRSKGLKQRNALAILVYLGFKYSVYNRV